MYLSAECYEHLDHVVVHVRVLSRDIGGGVAATYDATEYLPRPPWLTRAPEDWISLVGERLRDVCIVERQQ